MRQLREPARTGEASRLAHNTHKLTPSLTHSLTHSHSLSRSLTHSPTHSLAHSLTHSPTHSLAHSTHSLTHSLPVPHSLTHQSAKRCKNRFSTNFIVKSAFYILTHIKLCSMHGSNMKLIDTTIPIKSYRCRRSYARRDNSARRNTPPPPQHGTTQRTQLCPAVTTTLSSQALTHSAARTVRFSFIGVVVVAAAALLFWFLFFPFFFFFFFFSLFILWSEGWLKKTQGGVMNPQHWSEGESPAKIRFMTALRIRLERGFGLSKSSVPTQVVQPRHSPLSRRASGVTR